MNRDHSVIFEDAPKYCISDSFVDYEGYTISSNGFLPTVVDRGSSELNLPIPIHFISWISKMSVFILAISCLTTSNFPWFVDLTFYSRFLCNTVLCSAGIYFHQQTHQQLSILPLWPSCFIHSGAIGNFPLLLPGSVLDTFRPRGTQLWCPIFLAFCTVHEVLMASILGGLPFPPLVDHVLSEFSAMTHPSWVALHSMARSIIELCRLPHHNKAMIREGVYKGSWNKSRL